MNLPITPTVFCCESNYHLTEKTLAGMSLYICPANLATDSLNQIFAIAEKEGVRPESAAKAFISDFTTWLEDGGRQKIKARKAQLLKDS